MRSIKTHETLKKPGFPGFFVARSTHADTRDSMITNPERFAKAIALFDAANAQDPNQDEGQPKELLYAKRMTDMIGRFAPEASEVAQLAVRAQHIQRWTVPRSNYPLGKP